MLTNELPSHGTKPFKLIKFETLLGIGGLGSVGEKRFYV